MKLNIEKAVNSNAFRMIYVLLVLLFLGLAIFCKSFFSIECAACTFLFSIIQLRLNYLSKKEDKVQKKKFRPIGILLLIPSLGVIAAAVGFLFQEQPKLNNVITYGLIGIAAVIVICLVLQIIILRKDKSIAAQFTKLMNFAVLSAPSTLAIGLLLSMTETEQDTASLVCMTGAVFGGFAFLLSADMILISLCGYKGSINSIKTVSALIKSKKFIFTRVSLIKDGVYVVGKAILSIVSLSFFMFVNALYSVGMGLAKFISLKMRSQSKIDQLKSYRNVGLIIFASSICYVIYSIRLFFGGSTGRYPMTIALVIALYTFVEFGINIREVIRLRKSKALEVKALRAISFASTLLCFVLTQTAIMSFSDMGNKSHSNALSGVVFGGCAALVGLYVIIRSHLLKRHVETYLYETDESDTSTNF